MQRLEVSCAVRLIYTSLGAKGLTTLRSDLLKIFLTTFLSNWLDNIAVNLLVRSQDVNPSLYKPYVQCMPVFINRAPQGSVTNRRKYKNFKMTRIFSKIPENYTGIFVGQLAILM